jgi:hypothetical protein
MKPSIDHLRSSMLARRYNVVALAFRVMRLVDRGGNARSSGRQRQTCGRGAPTALQLLPGIVGRGVPPAI